MFIILKQLSAITESISKTIRQKFIHQFTACNKLMKCKIIRLKPTLGSTS